MWFYKLGKYVLEGSLYLLFWKTADAGSQTNHINILQTLTCTETRLEDNPVTNKKTSTRKEVVYEKCLGISDPYNTVANLKKYLLKKISPNIKTES